MEFSKITYPEAPVMSTELLGDGIVPGYSCALYRCKDTPHLMAQINGVDYVIKVSSIFKTIIETVGIEPNENYSRYDAKKRGKNRKKND